ncbi:MAG: hypothetical protein V1684_02345 [bacterium]
MTDQRVLSGGEKIFRIAIFCFGLILCFALAQSAKAQEPLPQPYLLFPSSANYQTGSSLPIITGETQNNTFVEVYFDGQLTGQATVASGPLLTGYFTFRPTKNLAGGDHEIYIIAKDKNDSQLTSQSVTVKLHIWAFPKPTLFPISQYRNGQPVIQGVAKNDSLIRIFAEGQLQATFPVTNHPSGTAAFSWVALSGKTFSATATDPEGKASALSNLVGPSQPAATEPESAITEKPTEINPPASPDGGQGGRAGGEESAQGGPAEGEVEIIGNGPITAIAKTFNKKSFWLWGLLTVIVITIIIWLRKNLRSQPSGEVIGQEIKPAPPSEVPKTEAQLPLVEKKDDQPPVPPASPSQGGPTGGLDNF